MQFFLAKSDYFFILNFGLERQKKRKRALRDPNEGNKLCILDGTKHKLNFFGILHFIVLK